MQRRAGRVFERVADCVAGYRGLVRLGALAAILTRLNELFRIVPRAASIVEEERQQDTGDGTHHEQACKDHGAEQWPALQAAHEAEDEADSNRRDEHKRARLRHLSKSGPGYDRDTPVVIGLFRAVHDPGALGELRAYLIDHVLGTFAHSLDGHSRKGEHEHATKQAADEDLWDCEVDGLERQAALLLDDLHERRKEQEAGETGRADRISLGGRLGHVADRVEPVGDVAHNLRLLSHLDDTARVVGDRPKRVHGEYVDCRREHPHRRDRGTEEAPSRDGPVAKVVGNEDREARAERRIGRRLHADRHANNDVRAVTCGRRGGDATHGLEGVIGIVLGELKKGEGIGKAEKATARKFPPGGRVRVGVKQEARRSYHDER
mmetsp:Transcript_4108/g.10653  ORF Transcript_4108/g.10653 Transcript_4108/m.10653 type:complete len:378 (+) Transcript_4108:533-1666(+)